MKALSSGKEIAYSPTRIPAPSVVSRPALAGYRSGAEGARSSRLPTHFASRCDGGHDGARRSDRCHWPVHSPCRRAYLARQRGAGPGLCAKRYGQDNDFAGSGRQRLWFVYGRFDGHPRSMVPRPSGWGLPRDLKVHHNTAEMMPWLKPYLNGQMGRGGRASVTRAALADRVRIEKAEQRPVAGYSCSTRRRRKSTIAPLGQTDTLVSLAADNVRTGKTGLLASHRRRFAASLVWRLRRRRSR